MDKNIDNKSEFVNQFICKGVVNNIYFDGMSERVRVSVAARRNQTAFLDISISHDDVEYIKPRQYVAVNGFANGFYFKDRTTGDERFDMHLDAIDIAPDKTEIMQKFNVDEGNFYGEQFFRAYFLGKISKVWNINNRWARIELKTIKTEKMKKPSYIRLEYPLTGQLPKFDYVSGDIVCIVASVHTPEIVRKSNDNKKHGSATKHYLNFVVEDIAHISKAARPNPFEVSPYSISGDKESTIPIEEPSEREVVVPPVPKKAKPFDVIFEERFDF